MYFKEALSVRTETSNYRSERQSRLFALVPVTCDLHKKKKWKLCKIKKIYSMINYPMQTNLLATLHKNRLQNNYKIKRKESHRKQRQISSKSLTK